MKFLVVLSVAVACVVADVSHLESQAPIVRVSNDINPDGSYLYTYETGNGIFAQQKGSLKSINNEYPSIAVDGAFKYQAPDGTPIEVAYTADENGFRPVGKHLPVAPEIPEAIYRSLQYIAAHSKQ